MNLTTTLETAGPAVAIVLTEEQVTELGDGRRPAVVVKIGGHSERLRVAPMGGRYLIGFRKDVREAFGVTAGDVVDATITLDEAPREVEIPSPLATALATYPAAAAAWEKLSYTRRKELAAGIAGAKRDDTRERRLAAALTELCG